MLGKAQLEPGHWSLPLWLYKDDYHIIQTRILKLIKTLETLQQLFIEYCLFTLSRKWVLKMVLPQSNQEEEGTFHVGGKNLQTLVTA